MLYHHKAPYYKGPTTRYLGGANFRGKRWFNKIWETNYRYLFPCTKFSKKHIVRWHYMKWNKKFVWYHIPYYHTRIEKKSWFCISGKRDLCLGQRHLPGYTCIEWSAPKGPWRNDQPLTSLWRTISTIGSLDVTAFFGVFWGQMSKISQKLDVRLPPKNKKMPKQCCATSNKQLDKKNMDILCMSCNFHDQNNRCTRPLWPVTALEYFGAGAGQSYNFTQLVWASVLS